MTYVRTFTKAEYMLLFLAILCFCVTVVCRSKMVKACVLLDEELKKLCQSVSPLDGVDGALFSDLVASIQEKTKPYTYFLPSLEQKLSDISSLVYSFSENFSDVQKASLLISEIQNFQNLIYAKQRELLGIYDTLVFFPIILAFLSVCVILYKRLVQASELERITLVNKKQRDFSRNLHDTVAQDMAAVRVYIENGDIQKSTFFADRALKEIRYMIDSLDSSPDKSVTELIYETVRSFEVNYKIKTELLITSKLLKKSPQNVQMEILYVIQEALSNIARHSNASKASVKITDIVRSLKITIRDNGKGFDKESVNGNNSAEGVKHHGIKNICERVSSLGGSVQFINDGGCVIAISIENIVYRRP